MTDAKINKLIALYCGWRSVRKLVDDKPVVFWQHISGETLEQCPQYTDDLNLMAEAADMLSIAHFHSMGRLLAQMLCKDAWNANAAERAEAFLKTVGEWEEDEE